MYLIVSVPDFDRQTLGPRATAAVIVPDGHMLSASVPLNTLRLSAFDPDAGGTPASQSDLNARLIEHIERQVRALLEDHLDIPF